MLSSLKYGIIGWPVEHSLSPVMQEAAFRAAGIQATYERIPVKPDDLASRIGELRRSQYKGWNVTVPHKQAVIPELDDVDTIASLSQSVNTVLNDNGTLRGYSTDGYGLEIAIQEAFNVAVRGGRFLFWGTGGAAYGCAAHFATGGAQSIVLVNRTLGKAKTLQSIIGDIDSTIQTTTVDPADLNTLHDVFANVQVIIQSTNLGLKPNDPIPIPLELLKGSMCIFDMIYRKTPLLQFAEQHGCRIGDGRGMLLHQGARSFSIWTGRDAPVEVMRHALDTALADQR